MAGTVDVHELRVGDGPAELRCAVFGEQVAVAAPHEQAWHAQSSRCGVQGSGVSGADQARGAVDELWVPVPAVATVVAEAKVALQTVEVFGGGAVRVVGGDRFGDFFDRRCGSSSLGRFA